MAKIRQFVTFYLKEKLYGIDIRIINEVNTNFNIISIPLTEPYVRGHVNVRGQVVLIIDIMVILGLEISMITGNSHIIILKTYNDLLRIKNISEEIDLSLFGDKYIGFIADNIGDVISVPIDKIENPTKYIENEFSKYISGVFKFDKNILTILDPKILVHHKNIK